MSSPHPPPNTEASHDPKWGTPLCSVDEVITQEELERRPRRAPDHATENAALVALIKHLAESPKTLLQKLTETALTLCRAESAGISIEEVHEGQEIFRWRAVSGRLSPFLNGTMPRRFSPCGTTVDRRAPQIMQEGVRYYPYMETLQVPLQEVLLVPFYREEKPVGTLWIVSHEKTGVFDAEDARIMGSLCQFASAAVEVLDTLQTEERTRHELAEVKTKLESALEAGAIATWSWDVHSNRVHVDPYCAALFAVSDEDAHGGPVEHYVSAMHPDDRDRVAAQIQASILHDEPYDTEYRVRSRDGERWVLARGKILRDEQGRSSQFAGVLADITARKEQEMRHDRHEQELREKEREIREALRQARDQALAASRAKDEFLAALSHELRTPLNPVLLLASDAASNPAYSAVVRADFDTVRKNVELEARLIDDLLDVTRIASGKLKLDTALCDLHAVLRDAVAKVQADADEKNISLQWGLDALQPRVSGDAVRLQQVFWNVLKNAVKFTPVGGIIRIESRNISEDGQIQVQIHDNGIGIQPDDLARIFDAFAQGALQEGAGMPLFGGLGLGLAISQRIMQMHSGRIVATSGGSGQGSCFSIEMPVVAITQTSSAEVPAASSSTHAATATSQNSSSRLNILIVEDHAPSRQVLERLLIRRGHQVTPAGSGHEACAHVTDRDFDLVVCDVGLPDTDGHTLLQQLHRLRPGLPAIALTGYGTESDVRKSDIAGFITHLTKPVSIARLEAAMGGIKAGPMA
ncbi:MAG: ATP-binding protein [Prosthecobacter sp.]